MPMLESAGGDDDVAAAEDRRVAGEAPPAGDAHQRLEAREPAEVVERQAVQAGDAGAVRVARATASAFGEEDDRQPVVLGHLEEAVLLAVVVQARGARQHRVVVGGHRPPGGRRRSPTPPTRPSPGVFSRRSSMLRRFFCAATTSGPYSMSDPSSIRSATFSRAVRLPSLRRRSTASGRFSSSPYAVALDHLGQVGPDLVEVDVLGVEARRGQRRRPARAPPGRDRRRRHRRPTPRCSGRCRCGVRR